MPSDPARTDAPGDVAPGPDAERAGPPPADPSLEITDPPDAMVHEPEPAPRPPDVVDVREEPRHGEDVGEPDAEAYSTGSVPVLVDGWDGVRRRHRRQTLTFLGAFALVIVVGLLAWLTYLGWVPWPFGGAVNVTQTACTRSEPLPPKKITLRVYNGSERRGLAGQVAVQLKAFGFNVQETGNDPLEAKLRTPIEIRHGDSGDLAALTTTAYLSGRVRDVVDDRLSDSVDVVLGPAFTRVHTRREVAQALAGLTPRLPLTCPRGSSPPASGTTAP